jgi:hypothetical protein
MQGRVYLSAADRQLENFLDEEAFDRSLFLNILFQNQVLVVDILYVISAGVERHLDHSNETLLEAAIRHGFVVSSLRSGSSFSDAYNAIKGQKIQGVRNSAASTIIRLERAAEQARDKFQYINPKVHLATTFEEQLRGALQREEPPILGPQFGEGQHQYHIDRLWQETKRWRIDAIDRAAEVTRAESGESGIRRGELMNAIAHQMAPESQHRIDDISQLFAMSDTPALRAFCQWISEIYLYNHAVQLNAVPSLPTYNPLTAAMLKSRTQTVPPLMEYYSRPVIVEVVDVPTIQTMRNMDPSVIIGIREAEGAEYLADLTAWQRDPDDDNLAEAVRKSLRKYSKRIVARVKGEPKSLVKVVMGRLPSQARLFLTAAAAITIQYLKHHPEYVALAERTGMFMALADGCYVAYQGVFPLLKPQEVTLMADANDRQEVNILSSPEI